MATDDRLRQYSEAGEELLEGARTRAVDFLRELARVGQASGKQAQGQVDDLVDAGRRSTEALLDVVRREIAAQLGQLGLATKSDLEDLERRLGGRAGRSRTPAGQTSGAARKAAAKAPAPSKASPSKAAPSKAGSAKAAPAKAATSKAAPSKATPTGKAPAKRAPAAGKAPAARKAPVKKAGGPAAS